MSHNRPVKGISLPRFNNIAVLTALFMLTTAGRAEGRTTDETNNGNGDAASIERMWQGFSVPQDSTRTKVWWFHGETETTREGITADLEAFKSAGVGGVVYYDQVHLKNPTNTLDAFSNEWWGMLRFAAAEAERLGLTFEAHVGNGFVAGGPWITKELGMQMLAASDTVVSGGQKFRSRLPLPANKYGFYRDVAVLAFPIDRDGWTESGSLAPRVSADITDEEAKYIAGKYAPLNVENIFKDNVATEWIPAREKGEPVYVNIDFDSIFTARSISYNVRVRGKATTSATNVPGPSGEVFTGTGYRVLPDLGTLEASDDGRTWREVCKLKPIYKAHSSWNRKTIAFPAVTARHYRLNLHDWYLPDDGRKDMQIGNICLSPRAKADQWEEKAGLFSEYIEPDRTPQYSPEEVIRQDRIIDITHLLDNEGVLRWDVPEGEWAIMRFVHQPTGGRTKHGRKNLMGLECDKLSAKATTIQWNNYFKQILDTLRHHNLPIRGMAMDSHEAGSQNWTVGFENEFLRLRGYELTPLLPAMAGYIIDSIERTDSILHDVRRTIADLISERYYGTLDSLCHSEGMRFTAQATGNALCIAADPIQAKGRVDIPQGEFWAIHPDGNYDIKESSSAAHIYGKPIASAEAFTDAHFEHSPAFIKSLADYAYCYGINEFVVCASAYQPWLDKIPGSTGGGRHYCLNRNNTYWEYLRPFWNYQARCAFMMRQGKSVNDICIYLGENAPVKILTHRLPDIPGGYDFDAFTADALHSRMTVKDGKITLPDGTAYSMMILPRNGDITPKAKARIEAMKAQGAAIYSDWSIPLGEALTANGIMPDISMSHTDTKAAKVWYAHRRLDDGNIYFIHNHSEHEISDSITLRAIANGGCQWWDAVTGKRHYLPYTTDKTKGTTTTALTLAPWQSGFIVLAPADEGASLSKSHLSPLLPMYETVSSKPLPTQKPWRVFFDPKLGGAGEELMNSLTDWRQHPDKRISNYSGTATYRNTFTAPRLRNRQRLFLQFDRLGDVARVSINGREAGIVWCSPWQIDISEYVENGKNTIEINVANSLINRMIADEQLPQEERTTFAYPSVVTKASEAMPSGIIGNMQLIIKEGSNSK